MSDISYNENMTMQAKRNKAKKIGLRDFVRNSRAVREQLERGQVFTLLANGVEIAKLTPIKRKGAKYSKEDYFNELLGSVKSKAELSNKEIDEIIYGKN